MKQKGTSDNTVGRFTLPVRTWTNRPTAPTDGESFFDPVTRTVFVYSANEVEWQVVLSRSPGLPWSIYHDDDVTLESDGQLTLIGGTVRLSSTAVIELDSLGAVLINGKDVASANVVQATGPVTSIVSNGFLVPSINNVEHASPAVGEFNLTTNYFVPARTGWYDMSATIGWPASTAGERWAGFGVAGRTFPDGAQTLRAQAATTYTALYQSIQAHMYLDPTSNARIRIRNASAAATTYEVMRWTVRYLGS